MGAPDNGRRPSPHHEASHVACAGARVMRGVRLLWNRWWAPMSIDEHGVEKWRRRRLLPLALAGPPALALVHVVIYVAHRASVGTVPAEAPAELYSLVAASAALIILLYLLGAPAWLLIVDLAATLVSLAAAPVVAMFLILMMAAR